jgi:hypothetical protein
MQVNTTESKTKSPSDADKVDRVIGGMMRATYRAKLAMDPRNKKKALDDLLIHQLAVFDEFSWPTMAARRRPKMPGMPGEFRGRDDEELMDHLEKLRTSTSDYDGDELRRFNDWRMWILRLEDKALMNCFTLMNDTVLLRTVGDSRFERVSEFLAEQYAVPGDKVPANREKRYALAGFMAEFFSSEVGLVGDLRRGRRSPQKAKGLERAADVLMHSKVFS